MTLNGRVVSIEEQSDGKILAKLLTKPGIRWPKVGDDLWVDGTGLSVGDQFIITIEEKND